MSPTRRRLVLGLILLVAAVFRLPRLTAESLWADEILTVRSATVPLSNCLDVVRQIENAPPLYFVLMNRWVAAFGVSDASLRLPSALAGIAGVAVIYLLGRQLFDNEPFGTIAGLWSAGLLAVQPYHIAYSMEARPYALMFLLGLCSCYAMAVLLRKHSLWAQVGYVLASAAMLWTHTMAGFLLIAQNLVIIPCLIHRDGRQAWAASSKLLNLRGWLVLQCLVAILMIPWLGPIRTVWAAGAPWIGHTTIPHVIRDQAGGIWLAAVWSVLAATALILGWRRIPVLLCLAIWLVPIVLPAMLSTRSRQILLPRYAIPAIIGIDLLCGYAAAELGRRRHWFGCGAGAAALTASLFVSLPLLANGHTLQRHNRPDMRSAARQVTTGAHSGDIVCADDAAFDYYFRRNDLVRTHDLGKIPPAAGAVWVVHYADQQPHNIAGYVLSNTWSYDGVRVERFENQQ